jgi:hypothetical protein
MSGAHTFNFMALSAITKGGVRVKWFVRPQMRLTRVFTKRLVQVTYACLIEVVESKTFTGAGLSVFLLRTCLMDFTPRTV